MTPKWATGVYAWTPQLEEGVLVHLRGRTKDRSSVSICALYRVKARCAIEFHTICVMFQVSGFAAGFGK